MIDPPRAAVPDAVGKCRSAGIKVCTITIHNGVPEIPVTSQRLEGQLHQYSKSCFTGQ